MPEIKKSIRMALLRLLSRRLPAAQTENQIVFPVSLQRTTIKKLLAHKAFYCLMRQHTTQFWYRKWDLNPQALASGGF